MRQALFVLSALFTLFLLHKKIIAHNIESKMKKK